MPKQSKTAPILVRANERAREALELRKAGATFKQIAASMHFSEQRAYFLVSRELARLNAERAELATDVTRLELERMDALWLGLWPRARGGDEKAVATCLRIMERRARILGLDAPTKIAPTNPEGDGPAVIRVVYDAE